MGKDIDMRDFTFEIYSVLLRKLSKAGYRYQTLTEYIENPMPKVVLIRHDIDLVAQSAIPFAKLERTHNAKATYYFRNRFLCNTPKVIESIASLGHEIGYHYEDLTTNNGDYGKAITDFARNLEYFRKFYPVKTVCMHGCSSSPYDNRDLWTRYDLSQYGLIAEPYISLDFNSVLYLSDTSQKWNGSNVALRDKVTSDYTFSFTTTWDILQSINKLPDQVMLTIHPELWTNSLIGWLAIRKIFQVHTLYKTRYRNKRVLKQREIQE